MKADAITTDLPETAGPTMVRIRPETREKVERVAEIKSWTLTEAFDQAIDALIARDPQLKSLRR